MNGMQTAFRSRLLALLERTQSDFDGEVVAACNRANSALREAKLSWGDALRGNDGVSLRVTSAEERAGFAFLADMLGRLSYAEPSGRAAAERSARALRHGGDLSAEDVRELLLILATVLFHEQQARRARDVLFGPTKSRKR